MKFKPFDFFRFICYNTRDEKKSGPEDCKISYSINQILKVEKKSAIFKI